MDATEPMPSDPMDVASLTEQRDRDAQLARIAHAAKTKRLPVDPGFCDVCGEETETSAHLFCSTFCRDKDALREKAHARNGNR